jgi:sulfate permease, SulP family
VKPSFSWNELLQNVFAGLAVSFVSLSTGAALGVLSGRGAFAGMLAAAVYPIIASLLGGTRRQCSSPTGLSCTMAAIIVAAAHDRMAAQFPGLQPDHFVTIVLLMTAVFLLIAGLLRLGKLVSYVPNLVISGFMNGVAIILWQDQIKALFGWGGKEAIGGPLTENLVIVGITMLLAFGLPVVFRRTMPRMAGILPVALITIVIMTAAANLLALPVEHVAISTTLNSVSDVTALVQSQIPSMWSWAVLLAALPFALQLTVLAYLDTLLTSLILDKMTGEPTKQNRELGAQSLAMAAVAFLGAVPGAQATANCVMLLKERATMRLAGVLVGIFVLVEILIFQHAINLIPQAVFSGILFKVGYDVFDWKPIRLYIGELLSNWHALAKDFFSRHDDERIFVTNLEMVMIIGTTLVTVLWDLNIAVGVFTALFYLVNKWFWRTKPMRDLKPIVETEGISDEG